MNKNNSIERSIILRILRRVCPSELYEGIEGDLIEQYDGELKIVGEKKARINFLFHALKFIRPGIILRNKFSIQLINLIMRVAESFEEQSILVH